MNRPGRSLDLLVFVVGAGTLGSEIAAARLLAPWFGASTIVWANTIAIVLVALSIGYAAGGRLADRFPHVHGLAAIVLTASALLAVVPFVSGPTCIKRSRRSTNSAPRRSSDRCSGSGRCSRCR